MANTNQSEMKWMPIESAPNDGTELLVCTRLGKRRIETGHFLHAMREAAVLDGDDCFYVGWMPLPPAPPAIVGWNRRAAPTGWSHVEREGVPPCDGETVYVGVNSAGFACCFNDARPDGLCLMGSPECSTAQMSELRWWRALDLPSPAPQES